MRAEQPKICGIKTPLCKHTLHVLVPGKNQNSPLISERVKDEVAIVWELTKTPTTPQEIEKLKSFVPFIIFDTVDDGDKAVTTQRRDGSLELYSTGHGVGFRKQLTTHSGGSVDRHAKRFMLKLFVDPKICPFFTSTKPIATDYLFAKSSGTFVGWVEKSFFEIPKTPIPVN